MRDQTVIIRGRGLRIEQGADTVVRTDTPPAHDPSPTTAPPPSTINSETVRYVNPFWSEEANRAADNRPEGVTPRDVARQYKNHRIENPYVETD